MPQTVAEVRQVGQSTSMQMKNQLFSKFKFTIYNSFIINIIIGVWYQMVPAAVLSTAEAQE